VLVPPPVSATSKTSRTRMMVWRLVPAGGLL